jgi:cytochrome c-type biogenesis protein
VSLLPALLARSSDGSRVRSPFFIIAGLSGSIFLFSLLLKASTLLLDVPQHIWQIISGSIIIAFGLTSLFPTVWEKLALALKLQQKAQSSSSKALGKTGRGGDILLGASLGPVFSACSPTYAVILATVLPVNPAKGLLYLGIFIFGLSLMLSLIAYFGNRIVKRLGWGINPRGIFKKVIGIIFIAVGILLITGGDKQIQSVLVERGWFDWQVKLETKLGR